MYSNQFLKSPLYILQSQIVKFGLGLNIYFIKHGKKLT